MELTRNRFHPNTPLDGVIMMDNSGYKNHVLWNLKVNEVVIYKCLALAPLRKEKKISNW